MGPAGGKTEDEMFLQERGFSVLEMTGVGLFFFTRKGRYNSRQFSYTSNTMGGITTYKSSASDACFDILAFPALGTFFLVLFNAFEECAP